MKRIFIFFLVILGIFSCGDSKKAVKKDLEELKTALEKISPEIEKITKKSEEIREKKLDSMSNYRKFNETEEEKQVREKAEEEFEKKLKEELLSEKRPETKEVRKIVEKMKKNVSKVKAKNEAEVRYYYYVNHIIENTENEMESIDNFENYVKEQEISFGFGMSASGVKNIIYEIGEMQKYPI